VTLSNLAKFSTTLSAHGLSATAELFVFDVRDEPAPTDNMAITHMCSGAKQVTLNHLEATQRKPCVAK